MIDGMDVLAVREATSAAIEKMRAGEGPQFIEAKTYRFQGHSMADPAKYRDQAELEYWLGRDPLKTFPKMLLEREAVTQGEIDAVRDSVTAEVEAAIKFSTESLPPAKSEIFTDVYA
jgi:pyruvate dehydrogenase E1 component alpha subunit